jgi:aminoglycoside phosphotransferase (APT) family kinase protein
MSGQQLIEPLQAHRFEAAKLFDYLRQRLDGFASGGSVRQFQGGQSNPTFLLETPQRKCVLRKKPPGKLLPSAHQIDREYRIQRALEGTAVPVCKMLHYCTDSTIIGTEFYLMEFLDGRVIPDLLKMEFKPAERGAIQADLFKIIGKLHAVDYNALGLDDFGRPANYVARQLARWGSQYQALATENLPDMNNLMQWLGANIPERDETSIVHGDFRLGNMMIASGQPRIIGVLDWELATLGHPLADLAYCCMPFYLPHGHDLLVGYLGLDFTAYGLRNEDAVLDLYCRATGRGELIDWDFFVGFSFFRSAAIAEGVYARALAGNAADRSGILMHDMAKLAAKTGWEVVQRR